MKESDRKEIIEAVGYALHSETFSEWGYDQIRKYGAKWLQELLDENERQCKLLREAQYIMCFHQHACPMNIPNNFSGSNEHLSMYRDVTQQLEEYKGEINWTEYQNEWLNVSKTKHNKRTLL